MTTTIGMRRRTVSIITAAAFAASGAFVLATAPSASATPGDPHKVWVCKYVQKPGVNEVLKGGKNPIFVDYASLTSKKTEPFVGEEARRLRHEARDLARALAGARDAQTALDALADLEDHGLALPAASLARARRRIERIRQAAETALDDGMRRRLAGALDRAQAVVESWPLDGVTYDQLADRLTRFYRRARRLRPADWTAAQAEELHELRARVVIHRYQMDLVEPLWPRFARMWTGEAQRLRDRLGRHQDLLVLARLTAPRQPLARWRTHLVPAIETRRAVHVAAAARIAGRLLAEKPASFRRRLAAMWDAGG